MTADSSTRQQRPEATGNDISISSSRLLFFTAAPSSSSSSPAGQQTVLQTFSRQLSSCNTTRLRSRRTQNSHRFWVLTGEMSRNHHKVLKVTGGGVPAAARRVLQEPPLRVLDGRRPDAQLLTFSQRVLRMEAGSEPGGAARTGSEVRQYGPGGKPGGRWRNCCRNWLMESPGDPSWRQEALQRGQVELSRSGGGGSSTRSPLLSEELLSRKG